MEKLLPLSQSGLERLWLRTVEQWDAVFDEYRWLFGEGHGEAAGDPAPAEVEQAGKASGDIAQQLAEVLARHSDLLGGSGAAEPRQSRP